MLRDVAADLAVVLEAASLGLARPPRAPGNLFLSALPEDDDFTVPDVAVAVLSTGGGDPEPYLGSSRTVYMRATCQVVVRGPREDHAAGQELAFGVHSALMLPALAPYVVVRPRESAPLRLPVDGSDRPLWVFNVEAQYSTEGADGAPVLGGVVSPGNGASVFEAVCASADVPGRLVGVAGPPVDGSPHVVTADPSAPLGLPVVGVLVSKQAETVALVQRSGLCDVSAFGGPALVTGRTVFVGWDGRPTTTVPAAGESPSGVAFVQAVGVALGEHLFALQPSPQMVRLG